MSAALLACRGVSHSFGGPHVLDGVDFDVRAGEIHVLAGENGAGKSTLMRIMSGLLVADEGSFACRGQPTGPAARSRLSDEVAMIHQELSLAPSMSVLDNLVLGREPTGRFGLLRMHAQRELVQRALQRVGLDVDPALPVGRLPLGVRQLVEIAKALLREPSVLIMDEPTSALSRPEVLRLFALMNEIVGEQSRPTGIVYISHRMEEIYAVAHRITVLRDGRAIVTAPAAQLPANALIQAMVGRPVDESSPRARVEEARDESEPDALRLENVTVEGDVALHGISLRLRRREIIGLAGLQGSGAGTLLRALFVRSASAAVTRGEVLLNGASWRPTTPAASMARGVAYLPEDRGTDGLCRGLGVGENLTMPSLDRLAPRGWLRKRSESRLAEEGVRRSGVRCRGPEQPVATLSGGNQQKVALGKWLLRTPSVLLLHEPTRGVDIGAREEIYRLINQATADGTAVLLASTDLNELLGMSDRVLVLHRGRLTAAWDSRDATPHGVIGAALGEPVAAAEGAGS